MKKIMTWVLMLCLVLSGALCYAHSAAGTRYQKESDGIPINLKKSIGLSSLDKSNSIIATLNDNVLIVVFTESLGEVAVEITSSTGGYVQVDTCLTPNGLQFYIPLAGDYIVNFTLPNEDEYYGEFTVTD